MLVRWVDRILRTALLLSLGCGPTQPSPIVHTGRIGDARLVIGLPAGAPAGDLALLTVRVEPDPGLHLAAQAPLDLRVQAEGGVCRPRRERTGYRDAKGAVITAILELREAGRCALHLRVESQLCRGPRACRNATAEADLSVRVHPRYESAAPGSAAPKPVAPAGGRG